MNATKGPEERTVDETLEALKAAVCDPAGSVALTHEQIKGLLDHRPRSLDEYRLQRIAEWSQARYALDNRFVNLTLLLDQGQDAKDGRWREPPAKQAFKDLRSILAALPDHPALVVLGAPGSGKSTLLRRLQMDESITQLRDGGDRVCFFLSLNRYRADEGKPLPAPRTWLAQEWASRYPDLPPLPQLLAGGKVLLLLDALNEMPHRDADEYAERVGLWRLFIEDMLHSGNRLVFSCRRLDYSELLSRDEIDVPQIQVPPMDAGQVRQFLASYLPAKAGMIWAKLDGKREFELYQTPYLLSLLVEQFEGHFAAPYCRFSSPLLLLNMSRLRISL